MKRKQGQTAATIFLVLCFGGMLALFSQASFGDGDARAMHLDVSSSSDRVLREVLPAAIESATTEDAESPPRAEDDRERERPVRLLLR